MEVSESGRRRCARVGQVSKWGERGEREGEVSERRTGVRWARE